jgi:hypothetical protein
MRVATAVAREIEQKSLKIKIKIKIIPNRKVSRRNKYKIAISLPQGLP